MPDNKPGGLKLKLRKADTNRLKTETGRIKAMSDAEGSAEAQTQAVPPPAAPAPVPAPMPRPDQTAEIRDPMALRETSQGKLRRIQSPDETANAVAPAASPVAETAGDAGIKRETVRLKVVRDKKRTGPQILPPADGEGAPETVAPPPVAPPPPSPEIAPPSAQTVKISLPGLKKASAAAGGPSLKHATSTVRVQEPPAEEAGSTLKVAPPSSPAEFQETSTATLKLGLRQPPAPSPAEPQDGAPATAGPAGTIKIKPGPALTARPADADQNKQITATLKIRPGAAPEPPPAPVEPSSSNKQVTATLKIRSGAPEAPEAASTVRITPPTAAGAETVISQTTEEGAAEGPRPSLRLKRSAQPDEESEAASTVRLPGIGETPETDDASKTVALPTPDGTEEEAPAEAAEEAEAPAPKKGLKLKTGKKHGETPAEQAEGEEAAEESAAEEGEAAPAFVPRPVEGGPGIIAAIGSIAACGALGALLYRLVTDYLLQLR